MKKVTLIKKVIGKKSPLVGQEYLTFDVNESNINQVINSCSKFVIAQILRQGLNKICLDAYFDVLDENGVSDWKVLEKDIWERVSLTKEKRLQKYKQMGKLLAKRREEKKVNTPTKQEVLSKLSSEERQALGL